MAHSSTMEKLGSQAPDFNLKNWNPLLEQEAYGLSSFVDQPSLLVAFFCNHCPYVVHLRDSFVGFSREYQQKGLAVVAISSNDVETYPEDSPEKMNEDARNYSYPFPYLYDESQEVAKSYRAACTPDFFLYAENRKLVYRGQYDSSRPKNSNPVTGEDLRKAVDALIQGNVIPENQIPSMGCNIKWKSGMEPDYFAR